MTPYQEGYNTTLKWLRNGKTGKCTPERGKENAYYLEWWDGAAAAHHYQEGREDVVIKVEDFVLHGICALIVLAAAVLASYAMLSVKPGLGLFGCALGVLGIYSSHKLSLSIKKREKAKNERDQNA